MPVKLNQYLIYKQDEIRDIQARGVLFRFRPWVVELWTRTPKCHGPEYTLLLIEDYEAELKNVID